MLSQVCSRHCIKQLMFSDGILTLTYHMCGSALSQALRSDQLQLVQRHGVWFSVTFTGVTKVSRGLLIIQRFIRQTG